MTHFLLNLLIWAGIMFAVLASVCLLLLSILLYSVGKMHKEHGRGFDERTIKDDK